MTKIRVGTDCSGIEAPIVALKQMDVPHEHVFSCDYDKFVKKSFLENYSSDNDSHTFYDNITTRDNSTVDDVDLYVCGFPCQSFSVAGKQEGFNDPRGTIFFHVHDFLQKKNPKIFVLENVKGLISHDKGKTMKTILSMCEDLGKYNIYHKVLNTLDYGVPQNRERIYIIGIRKDIPKSSEFEFPVPFPLKTYAKDIIDMKMSEDKNNTLTEWELNNLDHFIEKFMEKDVYLEKELHILDIGASRKFASIMNNICPCLKASRCNYYVTNLGRKLTTQECLSFQGFPKDFKQGVSNHQFYKQIGNSMSVNVLVELFKKLLPMLKYK